MWVSSARWVGSKEEIEGIPAVKLPVLVVYFCATTLPPRNGEHPTGHIETSSANILFVNVF